MKKEYYKTMALVLCAFLVLVLSGCSKKKGSDIDDEFAEIEKKLSPSEKKSLEEVKKILKKTDTRRVELKGISFDDFWSKVKQEGQKWAGDKFYVAAINAGNVIGFDRHGGLAASWKADIIKCEEIKEPRPSRIKRSDNYTIYKGRKKIITMSEKAKTGGLIIRDDPFPFYGRAFDPKKVKISPKEAEKIANKHKGYTPEGFENYDYELKPIDPPDDTPAWRIGKRVNLKKTLEDKKAASDWWNVKVNAETGQVIE